MAALAAVGDCARVVTRDDPLRFLARGAESGAGGVARAARCRNTGAFASRESHTLGPDAPELPSPSLSERYQPLLHRHKSSHNACPGTGGGADGEVPILASTPRRPIARAG